MPSRLRPTDSFATDAVLVGDPGRALLLAQELLEQPKMSNHARGLWGYTGRTTAGGELTIQSTGMGGPSAALVIADLAELGVRRAVRVGTCASTGAGAVEPGTLVLVERAVATTGSAAAFGLAPGETIDPDPELTRSLREALDDGAGAALVASFDSLLPGPDELLDGIGLTDMQSVAVLARAAKLDIDAAAVLVVVASANWEQLSEERREEAEKLAGRAAARALSTSS